MGQEVASFLGLQGLSPNLPDINGTLRVGFSNIGLTAIGLTDYRKPGFRVFEQHFQDQVSWFVGRHSVKAGANLTRIRFSDGPTLPDLFGNVNFSNRFTGHPSCRLPVWSAHFVGARPGLYRAGTPAVGLRLFRH